MTAPVHEGGCLCGRVRYRASGAPFNASHCHCETCRRASGAAFVSWASIPAAGFAFTRGRPARHDSSSFAYREFCRDCGTQLVFRLLGADHVDITLASLDDPGAILPRDHIWTKRQISWIHLADGLPRFAANRDDGG